MASNHKVDANTCSKLRRQTFYLASAASNSRLQEAGIRFFVTFVHVWLAGSKRAAATICRASIINSYSFALVAFGVLQVQAEEGELNKFKDEFSNCVETLRSESDDVTSSVIRCASPAMSQCISSDDTWGCFDDLASELRAFNRTLESKLTMTLSNGSRTVAQGQLKRKMTQDDCAERLTPEALPQCLLTSELGYTAYLLDLEK